MAFGGRILSILAFMHPTNKVILGQTKDRMGPP
jgi:hypothetical protein